jgi:hypothetical protein
VWQVIKQIKQAAQWFAVHKSWFGEGRAPASSELAEVRAGICRRCPEHDTTSIPSELAGLVTDNMRRLIAYKAHLKLEVADEDSINVCGVCGCLLRSLVWTPIDSLVAGKGRDELLKLPAHCWQRKEANV